MKKILVTGSSGQLGSELKLLSKKFNIYNWYFFDRKDLDFLILDSINKKISKVNPDYIINCAAYTNVENAEDNYLHADMINNKAVGKIARWSFQNDKKLIHISTDYVFGDNHIQPIKVEEKPAPLNIYGKTKFNGEKICLKENPKSIIIRTSWLFSFYGKNFVKTIINLMNKDDKIKVVDDQIGSPTYAFDLASVIIKIIKFRNWFPGIYHYTNEGNISWYDFALQIKKIISLNKVKIMPIKTKNKKVLRPKFSVLNNSKIKSVFDIQLISYKLSLVRCIELIKHNEK